jgi:hypothetical protein
MRFSRTAGVSHPSSVVLDTMIHDMEAIVPFLPNITRISTEQVERVGGRIRIVRRWLGSIGAAPPVLRPFLSPDWLGWIDTAVWTPAEYKVDWQHTPTLSQLARLYDCTGTNRFAPDPDEPLHRTRIQINGTLVVHPEALLGVPRFLAPRLAPQIERFVINLVTPNLTDLAKGLQRYLDRQQEHSKRRHGAGGRA